MEQILLTTTRLYLALTAGRVRDERGDVPGWVMITVMTAGLVAVIGSVASTQLADMLRSALNQVR